MQNSEEIWRQIEKIFNLGKNKTHRAEAVSTEQFYKYFKQNATPLNNILDPETNMCFPGRGTHITRDMCFLGWVNHHH